MEKSGRTILGRYAVGAEIATGPLSQMYEGWDTTIERRVAIKSITLAETRDTEGLQQRIRSRREAQAADRLQHPHLVAIFDYGESSECAYIVTEYVEGTTLKAALDKGVRFSSFRICQLMADILAGLQYSHSRGIIHRDLKPSNIIVSQDGRAKIADFGGRGFEQGDLTRTGVIPASPAYMSPEQLRGETAGPRADIYSAGAILFELLTGEQPFAGEPGAIVRKALTTDAPKPSDVLDTVPRAFDSLVTRAMARQSDQRFADAKDFAQALGEALTVIRASHPKQFTEAPAVETPPPRPAARSRFLVAGGVLVTTAAAMGVIAAYWGSTQVHAPVATQDLRPSLPLPPPLPVAPAVAPSQDVNQAAAPAQVAPSPVASAPLGPDIPPDPQRVPTDAAPGLAAPLGMGREQTQAVPPEPPRAAPVDQPPLAPQVEAPSRADQEVPTTSPPPADIHGETSSPQRLPPAPRKDDHASALPALAKKVRIAKAPLAAAIDPVPISPKPQPATAAHASDRGPESVPATSIGRYDIVNGLRVFVPMPESVPDTPPAPEHTASAARAVGPPPGQGAGNADLGGPAATGARPAGPLPIPHGIAAPTDVLGRYEIVNGVRKYVSMSSGNN